MHDQSTDKLRCGVLTLLLPVLLCLLAASGSALAQQDNDPGLPAAEAHRRTASLRPDAARRRAQSFLRGRAADAGQEVASAWQAARAQHVALLTAQSALPNAVSLSAAWTAVGPLQVQTAAYGLVTGRVTAIAIDPNDTTGNTVYVGTSGGGVWKSTNAASTAVTFTPLTDTLPVFSASAGTSTIPSLSIGALSVQPGGTGVVLAGTGDPNDAADSYYGEGLLRSTDNGLTWSAVQTGAAASFLGEGFAGFAWSTASPQVVVAAISSAAEAAAVGASKYPGVRGLYYSTNAGLTWTIATVQDGSTVVQSKSSNYQSFRGNAATAVVWNPIRKKFYAAVRAHGYYESADGATWTRLTAQPGTGLTTANCPTRSGDYGLQSCPIFRGALAAQPTSGDLFALTVDIGNADQGLWQDACAKSGSACTSATVTWGTKIDASAMETSSTIAQGDYNLALAAIPAATSLSTTDTLLFVGAGDLYRCGLSGGCTLRNTTNATTGCAAPAGVAPAQHAIVWQANLSNSATPRMYFGNDGGLWRSLDGVRQQSTVCSADDATHFDNLNGSLGSLAEVAGMSSHPGDANILLAALGANGSAASTTAAQATNTAAWTQLGDGESGSVTIDQANGTNWLVQSGAGVALRGCTSGKACTSADFAGVPAIGAAQVSNDVSLVDAPAMLDPVLNSNVIVGTCRVWRGPENGGSAWSTSNAISPVLAGPSGASCNSSNALIRSIAAGGAAVITNGAQNSGSPVIYAGLAGSTDGGSTYGGHIFVTTSANTATSSTAWTDITSSTVTNDTANRFNAGGFDVSDIAVDPNDATGKTVYATVMGFGYPHVYRSANAGGTWTNISANLPNAPANSVAVDPNDPLIVYVAMDTGVYVTSDVTKCVSAATGTTANCWSVLGTALPNAPVVSLVASPGIAVPGSSSNGVLRAATYGRGIWQLPLLTAGQSLAPVAAFSPASLTFATQRVGSSSKSQTATLTNTGNTPMQIASVAASAGFLETDTCAGTSLTVNASCSIQVTFAPTAAGAITGSVSVYANVQGGYAALPVTGTAQGVANVVLTPATLAFPSTAVKGTSSLTLTVTNSGTGAAALQTPVASSDFAVASTTCGTTLAVNGTCSITVSFTPTQVGPRAGTLTLADAEASHTATLTGTATGAASVTLTPASLYFGNQTPLFTTTTVLPVTLGNTGTADIAYDLTLTGDYYFYYSNCGGTLYAGTTCNIGIAFSPTVLGTRTGTFTEKDSTGTRTVALSGSGITSAAVALTPASLTFASTAVNGTSASQVITVTNNGFVTAAFDVVRVTGDFGVTANTCGASLLGGKTCTLTVVFSPTADGTRTGTVTLPDRLGDHVTALTGTGTGVAKVVVDKASLTFATTAVGATSAAQTVTISNTGTARATLGAAAITGDFLLSGNTCSSTLLAGSTCTVSVVFSPAMEGQRTGSLTLAGGTTSIAVALTGTGTGVANVVLAPASVTFASTAVGSKSAAQSVTVSNSGSAMATLSTPVLTGDFALSANTCGSTLAAGARCTVAITFSPSIEGVRSGALSIADATLTHTVALGGTGTAGVLTASPTSLAFPDRFVSATGAAKTVTLTNTGTASVAVTGVTTTGDYAATSDCTSVAVGKFCTVSVTFVPTAVGDRPGTLTVASDRSATAAVIALSGSGKGAFNVVLTPTAVDFGPQARGTTSAVINVTISNTGSTTGNLASVSATGDFTVKANTCGTSLPAQTGCTVSLVFAPTASGTRTGMLTVIDDAGTQTATLTGTGTLPATDSLAPASLNFAAQQVNTISPAQMVTLTNDGDVALTLVGAQITSGDFTATNGCGTSLAAHSACAISVSFAPKSVGSLTGTLQVSDVLRAQTVTLAGMSFAGPGVSLSPSSLTFAATGVGVAGAPQTLTLTNNGGVPLQLSAITVTGNFGIVAGSSTCSFGAALPVGSACSMDIAFVPSGAGQRSGSVTVTSNAATQMAQLNGTGIDFSLDANGSTSVTISSGGSAVFPLLLRPGIATSDPVTYTCTGVPANAKCTVVAQYTDLSAISTVTVTVLTGTSATAKSVFAAALLLPLTLLPLALRRRTWQAFAASLVLSVALLAGGCGSGTRTADPGSTSGGSSSGSGSTSSSTPVTATGTYTIVASATAAGVTHAVPLTLIFK